jgi:hypothetical protein
VLALKNKAALPLAWVSFGFSVILVLVTQFAVLVGVSCLLQLWGAIWLSGRKNLLFPSTKVVSPPAAREPDAPMPLSASTQARANIAVQNPPPAPPGSIGEPLSAQPEGSKPAPAVIQTPGPALQAVANSLLRPETGAATPPTPLRPALPLLQPAPVARAEGQSVSTRMGATPKPPMKQPAEPLNPARS